MSTLVIHKFYSTGKGTPNYKILFKPPIININLKGTYKTETKFGGHINWPSVSGTTLLTLCVTGYKGQTEYPRAKQNVQFRHDSGL